MKAIMESIVWGPLILQKDVMITLVVVLAGMLLLTFRLKQTDASGSLSSYVWNALFIWVLVWKLSVLLVQGKEALRHPSSLLYFNGGALGIALAFLAAIGYVGFAVRKNRKSIIPYIDSVPLSIIGGYSVKMAFAVFTGEGTLLTAGLPCLLGAAISGWWLSRREPVAYRSAVQRLAAVALVFALASAVAGNLGSRQGAEAAASVGLKVGQTAPDFELKQLDGTVVKLSDYRGKTVFLNFWATWCPPCQAEIPYLKEFHSANEASGAIVLGINATSTELSVPVVQAWTKEWKLSFPVALDSSGDVGRTYKVNAYPATYVIDANGIIREKHQGPMDKQMLDNAKRNAESFK
ncbi:redoxin domain-containing protein [Paenibacillus filicis]|uniref:Redoxin domain-containing protein n=1 Tax=Paenibacillus gyeongsangnamensis TaxID=3388067 RepID=A0ABT4QBP5_9BACL|nr:redoxin domain-containing protein [Paenibacillus filicis]MCZ8514105.1 redoxin domain-containing protein [Paenibacillus filicis]